MKDIMNKHLLALALICVAAFPARAQEQRCYQLTDTIQPPQGVQLSRIRTDCATTPTNTCWFHVTAWGGSPPPYDLWLAAPSSWNFRPSCNFFDYLGVDSGGDPVVRWLYNFQPCTAPSCNTQSPGAALNIFLTGGGTGSVTSFPTGINCPDGNCVASFPRGTTVTLTATPTNGSVFTGWSGAGCSGRGTCTVTMAAAASVTATFEPAGACEANCTCLESYSGTGEPGAFGGSVIIRIDRTVDCSPVRVHFLAEGTTFYGNYESIDGYIDIGKGEYTSQLTYNGYSWLYADAVSILDVQGL